jgi:acetate---CoA ligase (ADP-forming)
VIERESMKTTPDALDRLLKPRSVALVGASATSGSLGESVLINLENARYAGDLFLVNPKRREIHGRACLASIEDLPHDVDCAVLAIPGPAVVDAARECARKQVGSLIVFAAGFAESGEEGKAVQQELARIALDHGIIVEGPNCLGMVNYRDGVPLTFVVTPPQEPTPLAGAAIISQSGPLPRFWQ